MYNSVQSNLDRDQTRLMSLFSVFFSVLHHENHRQVPSTAALI